MHVAYQALTCRDTMGKWMAPDTMQVMAQQTVPQVVPGMFIQDVVHEARHHEKPYIQSRFHSS